LRDLLKNKKYIFVLSGLAGIVIVIALAINFLTKEKRELKFLQEQHKEMLVLKDEFLQLKQRIDTVENKKNLSNAEGVIQAVDEVFSSIGLKSKLKTVKSSGKREIKEGFEEEADLSIEKIDMNEMLNIFYKIENAPMVLTVKKATIKKSFENPELLDISLTLSFVKIK
jgi:hypothetical protein